MHYPPFILVRHPLHLHRALPLRGGTSAPPSLNVHTCPTVEQPMPTPSDTGGGSQHEPH